MTNLKPLHTRLTLAVVALLLALPGVASADHKGKMCNICGWRIFKPHVQCAKLKEFDPQGIATQPRHTSLFPTLDAMYRLRGEMGLPGEKYQWSEDEGADVDLDGGDYEITITDSGIRKDDRGKQRADQARKKFTRGTYTPASVSRNRGRPLVTQPSRSMRGNQLRLPQVPQRIQRIHVQPRNYPGQKYPGKGPLGPGPKIPARR